MVSLLHRATINNICPSLIKIGSKTAEKNSAQTNKQTNRHYENDGHLAVNQNSFIHNLKWRHHRYVHNTISMLWGNTGTV